MVDEVQTFCKTKDKSIKLMMLLRQQSFYFCVAVSSHQQTHIRKDLNFQDDNHK